MKVLSELDKKLDEGHGLKDFTAAVDELEDLCLDYPENPELLWRLGKAHHKISETTKDTETKKQHITKGRFRMICFFVSAVSVVTSLCITYFHSNQL